MNLYQVLSDATEAALRLQKVDGSMPSGHNGPYFHDSTPIRNTGHWAITFLKAYKITQNNKFKDAAEKALNYIQNQKELYPGNFKYRTVENRDSCNGVIGAAWTIEALLIASDQLNNPKLEKLATDLYNLHLFDKEKGLWHRCDLDGTVLSIDWTFNHQLWFAAAASMFDAQRYPEIHNQVKVFIDRLDKNFAIYKDGLIWHYIASFPISLEGIKRLLISLKSRTIDNSKMRHKAIGYHHFNLCAFGIIKQTYPDLPFWTSEKFQKALDFLNTTIYENGLQKNKYGFDYNMAGIEVAYTYSCFIPNSLEKQKYWVKKQFERHFDFSKSMMIQKTKDPETLNARLYEACRLNDFTF
ncbi:hypothetical protein [uncultured Draconibacterium sp.]|uniref:hypothetical protein n=1 Tax=uncultured Draconibacterium sp. TaxID=1573823 RepID=UPI0029C7331C|nr:hypothetical protein [uncultured Draconibacterium sp.]